MANWLCFVIFVFAGLAIADEVVLNETGREWIKVSDLPKGLTALEERIHQVGGEFGLESEPDQGTRITSSIPTRERI